MLKLNLKEGGKRDLVDWYRCSDRSELASKSVCIGLTLFIIFFYRLASYLCRKLCASHIWTSVTQISSHPSLPRALPDFQRCEPIKLFSTLDQIGIGMTWPSGLLGGRCIILEFKRPNKITQPWSQDWPRYGSMIPSSRYTLIFSPEGVCAY